MKLVGGFNPTPLKNDKVKVSWDDEPEKICASFKWYWDGMGQKLLHQI